MLSRALARVWSLAIWFQEPRSGETTIATGASPWMGISTSSQPRAKRKLDRAQPQEEGRHRSCAAPLLEAALYRACASRGASAELEIPNHGLTPLRGSLPPHLSCRLHHQFQFSPLVVGR